MTPRKSTMVTLTCPICEQDFEVVRNKRSKRKYCSYGCSNEAKHRTYIGRTFSFHKLSLDKGKEICELYVDKLMPTTEIAPVYNVSVTTVTRVLRKYKVERTPSEAALLRMRQHADLFAKSNAKKRGLKVGKKSELYKNGSGSWSSNVLKRDGYKCQVCGLIDKEIVQAHHIIPKSIDKTKEYDVDNGITLCPNCHVREHNRLRIKEE